LSGTGEPVSHRRARCGAKSHKHGVTILSEGGGFALSTLVGMNDNEMKGPLPSRDALEKKKRGRK
jgi:hypothetical protein